MPPHRESSRWAEAEDLLAQDPRLGPVIARVGPWRLAPARPPTLFAALFESIVHQQLHGRAARMIHERVGRLFPPPHVPDARAMMRISDDALRAAGLSRPKLAATRDLARRTLAGELPTLGAAAALEDDELVRRLTVVRGIGPWTVHMLLIFVLGRPDVWPVADFGVRRAVQKLWRKRALPDERFMQRAGATWRPWRSIASWYLWRAHELGLPAPSAAGAPR